VIQNEEKEKNKQLYNFMLQLIMSHPKIVPAVLEGRTTLAHIELLSLP